MTRPCDGLEEGARSTPSSHSWNLVILQIPGWGGQQGGRDLRSRGSGSSQSHLIKVWEAETRTFGAHAGCCRVHGRVDEPTLRLQARAESWAVLGNPSLGQEKWIQPRPARRADLCQGLLLPARLGPGSSPTVSQLGDLRASLSPQQGRAQPAEPSQSHWHCTSAASDQAKKICRV